MNTENPRDELSVQLSRELHRRTDGMHDTPLAFDDVRGQATSIRRRRWVATGVGVAAAVAVIVPTAMFATKGTNSDGPTPATQTPTVIDTNSPTPTSTPVMGPRPHALDVRGLPTGAPPGILYGNSIGLRTSAFARVGDHSVRVINGGATVSSPESDETFGPYPTSGGLARNDAGTAVAWTTDDGRVMAWVDGGSAPVTLAPVGLDGMQVEAVTGSACTPGKATDCLAYVRGTNPTTGEPESLTVTFDGGIGSVDPESTIIAVRDAKESGWVLGSTEITDVGSCSEVLDGTQTLLGTCDYQLDEFSPDGSFVLASEPYHDGIGSVVIAVFATAGDRLAYRVADQQHFAFYNNAVWEDDSHVLFSVYQDGMWSVVRMDAQGAMEYAVPPQPGSEMECPFVFETR